MDNFQTFLDATPEKGVIIVEYFWQPITAFHPEAKSTIRKEAAKTSLVFFRPVRAADDCWCGSKRRFARCHRRKEDWTYVTLDPVGGAYSPVVLLERTFQLTNSPRLRRVLEAEDGLLPIEQTESLASWGVPIDPPLVNETGSLILGTIGLTRHQMHLETNSEKRFMQLTQRVQGLLGDSLGAAATIRAEPQEAFSRSAPGRRRKRERS